jgi:hypothetical protein
LVTLHNGELIHNDAGCLILDTGLNECGICIVELKSKIIYLTSHIPQFLNSSIPQFLNSSIPQFLNSSIPQFLNSSIPQFYFLITFKMVSLKKNVRFK